MKGMWSWLAVTTFAFLGGLALSLSLQAMGHSRAALLPIAMGAFLLGTSAGEIMTILEERRTARKRRPRP